MPNPLKCVNHAVTGGIERGLGKLGALTARKPRTVACASVAISLFLALGFAVHFEWNNVGEEIWPPQQSDAFQDLRYAESKFPQAVEAESLIFQSKSPYDNVLDKQVLLAALAVVDKLEAISINGKTYQDFCLLRAGSTTECNTPSILAHWNYDAALLSADPDPANTVINVNYPDGTPPGVDDVGGLDGKTGKAFQVNFLIDNTRIASANVDSTEYGHLVRDAMLAVNDKHFNVFVLTPASIDEALDKSVKGDFGMVALGVIMMTTYAYLVLTRKLNSVQSRFLLTNAAAAAVVLGLVGAMGFVSALGVTFTNLNQVLIYVTMGIGIDDAFIITSSVDSVFAKARRRARRLGKPDPCAEGNEEEFVRLYSKAIRIAGSSIAFTSVTDLAAFLFGSFTLIPAVQWFCYYASVSVVFVFGMQVSLFSAALAMDMRRQAANHRDVVPCSTAAARGPPATEPHPDADLSTMQRFMKNKYAPWLVKTNWVRAGVVVAFLALAVVAGIGVPKMKEGLPIVDLTPKVHYARDYLLEVEKYWLGFQYSNVDMLFYHERTTATGTPADIARAQQLSMYNVRAACADSKWVKAVSVGWWFGAFIQYAEAHPDPAFRAGVSSVPAPRTSAFLGPTVKVWAPPAGTSFAAALQEFGNAVPTYKSNVALEPDAGGELQLVASTAHMLWHGQEDPKDVVSAMQQVRADVRAAAAEYDTPASISQFFFVFTEMDAVQRQEAMQNMMFALGGVLLVCLVFLGSIKVTLVVVAMVALIDLSLLGSLHYFNIKVNSISVINLVLALGLSVDQCAHVAHRYMEGHKHDAEELAEELEHERDPEAAKAPRKVDMSSAARAIDALWVLGASVFNGGASTFLAVAPLALASSQVFFTFFVMLTSIVVLGLAHGLILLPVLLSFFPDRKAPVTPSVSQKQLVASGHDASALSLGAVEVEGAAVSASGDVSVEPEGGLTGERAVGEPDVEAAGTSTVLGGHVDPDAEALSDADADADGSGAAMAGGPDGSEAAAGAEAESLPSEPGTTGVAGAGAGAASAEDPDGSHPDPSLEPAAAAASVGGDDGTPTAPPADVVRPAAASAASTEEGVEGSSDDGTLVANPHATADARGVDTEEGEVAAPQPGASGSDEPAASAGGADGAVAASADATA